MTGREQYPEPKLSPLTALSWCLWGPTRREQYTEPKNDAKTAISNTQTIVADLPSSSLNEQTLDRRLVVPHQSHANHRHKLTQRRRQPDRVLRCRYGNST
jgi:hypothetical protein